MADIEPLKPSNTGWLIADIVASTFAFGWARTQADPALLALLADPQWEPYLVFPASASAGRQVVTQLPIWSLGLSTQSASGAATCKRPLFVLLDATWPEARKMFRKSPYLDHLPVLHVQAAALSNYRLRRSQCAGNFCTSEVAALCLALAGEALAARVLNAWLDVFTLHYLLAKQQLAVDTNDGAHQQLRALTPTTATASQAQHTSVGKDADSDLGFNAT